MTNRQKYIEVMNETFNAGFSEENMNNSCSPCGAHKIVKDGCKNFTCDGCKAWWDKEYKDTKHEG